MRYRITVYSSPFKAFQRTEVVDCERMSPTILQLVKLANLRHLAIREGDEITISLEKGQGAE